MHVTELEPYAWQAEAKLAAALLDKLGVPATPLLEYFEATRERQARRVADTLHQTAQFSGLTPDQVVSRAANDDAVGDLLGDTLRAAAHARATEKIRALARVLAVAMGGGDGTRVDDLHIVVDTLDKLKVLEIRGLHAVGAAGPVGGAQDPIESNWLLIAKELRSEALASPVQKRLTDLTLINPEVDDIPESGAMFLTARVSPLGRRILSFLADQPTEL
ncbi:MAG: hypothetical protein JWO67_4337 [Streptosporangiaceae bacterium]|nr:hypothetical protein [Streptosporangiaceae bacterium]